MMQTAIRRTLVVGVLASAVGCALAGSAIAESSATTEGNSIAAIGCALDNAGGQYPVAIAATGNKEPISDRPAASVTTIPEPSTLVLLVLSGACAMLWWGCWAPEVAALLRGRQTAQYVRLSISR